MGATSSNVQGDFYLYEADQITLYDVTIQCFLSHAPHRPIELAWFKETECICLYKNGQVIKGRGYENRVSLLPEQLRRGNVSLTLHGFKNSDVGDYTCQVTDGDRTKQITVRVGKERLLYRIQNMANNIIVGALVMLLAVVIGAAAAIGAAVVIGAIVIASAILTNITFMIINRQWSPQETQKMEITALFAETQASLNERDKRIEDYCKHQLAILKIELQEEIKVLQEDFKHQQDTLAVKQQEEIKVLREDFQHQLAIPKMELQEEIKVLRKDFQHQLATLNMKHQEDMKKLREDFQHQLAIPKMELQKEIKSLREDFKHQLATLNVKHQEDMKKLREDFQHQLAIPKMELKEEIKVLRKDFQHQLATLNVKQQEEIKMLSEERLNNNSLKINRVLAPQCSGPNKIQSSNTPGTVYTNSVPLPPHFNIYTGGRKAGDFGGNS